MPRLNAMHRDTPTLAVIEPRGVSVRSVAYHRRSSAQTPRAHITQHTLDLAGRTSHSRDPRLFALHQDDESTRPNQTTLTSLSGRALLSNNVDAGWRLSLTGAADQALESWDEQLNHQRFVYDSLMRPLFGFEQVVGEAQRRTLCFSYADASTESARHNRCGQLIRHDDSAGTQHFSEFSVLGALLEQSRRFLESPEIPDWPVPEAERDQLLELQEAVTRTGCNAVGELIEHIDALGTVQSLHQTVAGELYETCVTLAGDVTPTTLVSQIQYNAFGQIEHQTAGNGVVTHATFDPADGHLKTLLAQVPGAAPLQNLTYTYDPVGNPVRISDDAQPIRYFRNQRIAAINTYGYDTLYRLIEARGRQRINASSGPGLPEFVSLPDANQLENYRQTFDYDAGGNLEILHHSAGSGSRTECTAVAALSNRSLPWIDGNERPTNAEIEAGYDANGNLKTLQRGQALQWDALNCLRQVDQVVRDDGPNDAECYVYDGSGQRLRKIRTAYTGTLTRTHETRYLPGVEIRTSPEETLHVISVQAGRCRVQILHWAKGQPTGIAANQQRYTLTDHLGSSTLELDKNADLISEESYYPYGGTAWWAGRDKVEASYKTIRYSGQERDATGLYYYGMRYYMPWRQRWLSADPMGAAEGLNLYGMVACNPMKYVDSAGLSREESGKAMLAAATQDFGAKLVGAGMKYGLSLALGSFNPVNWLVTGVGGASAAANGAIVGISWVRSLQDDDIGYFRRYAELAAGAAGGALFTAAPVIIGHFTNPGMNLEALKEVPSLIGNLGFEVTAQSIEKAFPGNSWTGKPPKSGIVAETAATITVKGAMAIAAYNLFDTPELLSAEGFTQEVVFSAATKGAVVATNSGVRTFYPELAPYQTAQGGEPEIAGVKLASDVATRAFFNTIPRLVDMALQSNPVTAVVGDGNLSSTLSFAAKSTFQVARNQYKRDIKSGLDRLVANPQRLLETKAKNYGSTGV
jgi:RHS repeat-associated protein